MARKTRPEKDIAPAKAQTNDDPPAKDDEKTEPARPGWRSGVDFIVMLGGAVLAALLIKAYLFDVYLIPSGSMETALHGRPDGGDRIFCTKINYRFRNPKRWEVAVFEFPYESAQINDPEISSEAYKNQNFVKRIVGLPGETLSIRRGDIWVRPKGSREDFRRVVKPDSVQRSMWLNVYEQDFRDISLSELGLFWKMAGGDAALEKGGPLRLSAESEPVRMHYRPLVPAGMQRDRMTELPGIPDRYTLKQPVQFRCEAKLESGEACNHLFVQSFHTQNMQARCPRCGSLENETSAVFYHRRSGLTAYGRHAVGPQYAPQGEEVQPRQPDYHIVPDLRLVADVTLSGENAVVAATLHEDSRHVQAVLSGDGLAELRINGKPSLREHRATTLLRPGATHRIEFYVVDGTARLFIDSTEAPVLDEVIWDDKRPQHRNMPKTSGVSLELLAGEAAISRLGIDRDVFYYSGWESTSGEQFTMMKPRGEVIIGEDSFLPMGDHCTSSYDARSWGPVSLSLLRGPAVFVWWPPERIGAIASP